MSKIYLEDYEPIVKEQGLNTLKNITLGGSANVDLSGSTGTFKFPTGAITGQKANVISGSGATAALTAAQSGSTVLFDRAAGIVYTLPAPVVGLYFDFITTVTITSNSAEVDTDAGTTFLVGAVELLTSASATTFAAYGNGTSHVKIASNGTTTGGIKGSQYRMTCISSTVWQVSGLLAGSGTLATPFA